MKSCSYCNCVNIKYDDEAGSKGALLIAPASVSSGTYCTVYCLSCTKSGKYVVTLLVDLGQAINFIFHTFIIYHK